MNCNLTLLQQMDESCNCRIFHIPPDKPHRAYVLRHDVLVDAPFDSDIFVEISLADGTIIKQVPRPLCASPDNEMFYTDSRTGYYISDVGRNFAVTVTKFDRVAGRQAPEVISTPANSRKFNLPTEVSGYDGRYPLPRMMLGDKFWLVSLFDSDENRGDGSKIFVVDVKRKTARVVSCLSDPLNGLFPGKRYSYSYTTLDNRVYVMGGVRRVGPVPFDIWELTLPMDDDSLPIWRLLPVKLPCTTRYSALAVSSDGCFYAMFANTFLDCARSTPASFRRLCRSSHSSLVYLGSINVRSLKQITAFAFLRYYSHLIGKTEEELREAGLPNYVMELLQ